MKILHLTNAPLAYRRFSGLMIAASLALNAAPGRAAAEESKAAPDAAMVAAHAAAKGDGLLEALLTELDRSKSQLKMDQVQAPYYVEYRVSEVEDFGAEAAFGALRENQHIHVRVLRVVVRIGDYKFRFIDQPNGWLGDKTKPDVPYITNLRLDPFERTGWPGNGTKDGAQSYFGWFKYEFWRFVFVQQEVIKLISTAIEFPPMQKGASFNLDAVKAQIEAAQRAHLGR